MNIDIILFSQIIWAIIRAAGLGVSLDFYLANKRRMHLYLTLGWFMWLIGGLFPLYAILIQGENIKNIVILNNLIFEPLGTIFVSSGIIMHFLELANKYILLICISVLSFLTLIYILIDFDMLRTYSEIVNTFFFIMVFLFPIIKKRKLKEILGESLKWYYITAIAFLLIIPVFSITMTQGYSYGLYEVDDPLTLILFYVTPISATILIIIYLIHMEYNITTQHKNRLKDKYSHNLGNILQCIMSANDLCNINDEIDKESKNVHEIIEEKCRDASKLINEIRKL